MVGESVAFCIYKHSELAIIHRLSKIHVIDCVEIINKV